MRLLLHKLDIACRPYTEFRVTPQSRHGPAEKPPPRAIPRKKRRRESDSDDDPADITNEEDFAPRKPPSIPYWRRSCNGAGVNPPSNASSAAGEPTLASMKEELKPISYQEDSGGAGVEAPP